MIFRLKLVLTDDDEFYNYWDVTSESSNKVATKAPTWFIEMIQHRAYHSGTTSIKYLDEPYSKIFSSHKVLIYKFSMK